MTLAILSSQALATKSVDSFFNPITTSDVSLSPNGESIVSIQYIDSKKVVNLKKQIQDP